MNFASDNASGVHPDILAAIVAANEGAAPSYGRDRLTRAAVEAVRAAFEAPEAEVFLMGTGTGANALALAQVCPPFGRIFCHEGAHIVTSESGAPGYATGGAMMAPLLGADGRITRETLRAALAATAQGDDHDGLNAVLSITNLSEAGTAYDAAWTADLAAQAHAAGMVVHLDGARFANAVAGQGVVPADLSWRAGVDLMSLGGTKNGCLALEAVVIFDPARAARFGLRRMQAGHLWSKHRFLAAQMVAWLDTGRWLALATHANAMAQALAEGLLPLYPVQGNEVFLRLPRVVTAALRGAGLRAADWDTPGDDPDHGTIRLVTSWATREDEVATFRRILGL